MMVWQISDKFGLVWFGLANLRNCLYLLLYAANLNNSNWLWLSGQRAIICDMMPCKFFFCLVWFGLAILLCCLYLVIYAAILNNSNWLWLSGPRAIICDGFYKNLLGLVWFGDFTILLISCDIWNQSKNFQLIITQGGKGYQLWCLVKTLLG